MQPKGYQIIESVPGFAKGDILNVTARFGYSHTNEMELECISSSPGSQTVIVTDEQTGFRERNILDETTRIGDWHEWRRTFDAGGVMLTDGGSASETIWITSDTLRKIAEPIPA